MKINQKLIEDKVINGRNERGRRVKDGKVLYLIKEKVGNIEGYGQIK
jgi:hypothetical protein